MAEAEGPADAPPPPAPDSSPGVLDSTPASTSVTHLLSVRCPDCRRIFAASQAAVHHSELICPSCHNAGFLAPGNAPQMPQRELDRLTERQFALYLRHGFQIVPPGSPPQDKAEWGSGSRLWSTLASLCCVAMLAAAVLFPALAASIPDGAPRWSGTALAWLFGLLIIAVLVAGHLALKKRAGNQVAVWAVVGIGWIVAAIAVIALVAGWSAQCSQETVGATWTEPGAGDALRAQGVGPPEGDHAYPAPEDHAPYISSLESVELVTWHVYYGAVFNGTAAAITVHADPGLVASDVRPGLTDFLTQLTGRPEESKAMAERILRAKPLAPPAMNRTGANASWQLVAVSIGSNGTITNWDTSRYWDGDVSGPFRTRELRNETQGNLTWKFKWDWAHRTVVLRDANGAAHGFLRVWGTGAVQADTSGLDVPGIRDAATRAFASSGLAPTFMVFHENVHTTCPNGPPSPT